MIKRCAIILCLLSPFALGQSNPGWQFGHVPTPKEWSDTWSGKADINNGVLNNPTINGSLVLGVGNISVSGANTAPITADGFKISVQNSATTAQNVYSGNLPGGWFEYDNIRSTIVVPSGSTHQETALSYYGQNFSTGGNLVGEWGIIQCLTTGSHCWALNPTITDTYDNTAGHSYASTLVGAEFDFSPYNAGSTICGVCLTGSANAAAAADGFVVSQLNAASPGTYKWLFGFVANDATSNTAIYVGASTLSGSNLPSMPSSYAYWNASGLEKSITMQASNGGMSFSSSEFSDGIGIIAGNSNVSVSAFGADSVVNLNLVPKGGGNVVATGPMVPVSDNTYNLGSAANRWAYVDAVTYYEALTTPASSTAACVAGQFTDDANYHYVCVATNSWKRVALSSF